jgi:hypothetical protein
MTGGLIEGNLANGGLSVGGGGGIAHLDSHPASTMTLNGVVVRGNGAPDADGGGIFNRGMLQMNGGELRGNNTRSGGGFGNGITGTLSGGSATLTSVTVDDNVATQYGGGVFNASTVSGTPTNTVTVNGGAVQHNRALYGGGIFLKPFSTVTIVGARVAGNTGSNLGGGIATDGMLIRQSRDHCRQQGRLRGRASCQRSDDGRREHDQRQHCGSHRRRPRRAGRDGEREQFDAQRQPRHVDHPEFRRRVRRDRRPQSDVEHDRRQRRSIGRHHQRWHRHHRQHDPRRKSAARWCVLGV